MFQFSGEDLWFLGILALFYIVGKWLKQWHVPNVATGKVFRWRTPISGLLFKDYLRRADVPETDPIRLPYKHIYITWYEKRRGEAAKGTVCKSGNKRYRRVRSNWHLEIASIQWWNFFLLPPVTGYCWFLSGCRTMRCSAVNQPLIKLAVLLSPQEDSRDKRCLWEVLMKRLWNIWYQLLYSTTLLRILHYLWLDMLFAFGDFGHRPPLRIWQRCSLHFVCRQCAEVTFMVLMRRFWLLVCSVRCDQAFHSQVLCFLCLLGRPLQIEEYLHYLLCSSRRGAVVHMNWLGSCGQ